MLVEKLKAIQWELKAPKGNYNQFGKYKYRSCEDILEAVKPLLAKQGCALTVSDELRLIGERYYIAATATLYDVETPAEKISVTGYAREEETKKGMDGSQITGASSSYARKYALNGLFCIDDTKDSDATNTGEAKAAVEKPMCAECGQEIAGVVARIGGVNQSYTAEEIVEMSRQSYGRQLCWQCCKAARKAMVEAGSEDAG